MRLLKLIVFEVLVSAIIIVAYLFNPTAQALISMYTRYQAANSTVMNTPLVNITVSDNQAGLLIINVAYNRLYHLISQVSEVLVAAGLVMLVILARLTLGKVLDDDKAALPLISSIASLVLAIPLPVGLYAINQYVTIMVNASLAFSGILQLVSILALVLMVVLYSDRRDVAELTIEAELTEGETLKLEERERTEVS